MNKRILFTTIMILVFFITNCAQNESIDYYPLNDGSKYEYSLSYSFLGSISEGEAVVRLDGEEVINGKAYQKIITIYSGIPGLEAHNSYYRRTDDGIHILDRKKEKDEEYLYLPSNLEVGSSWVVKNLDEETAYHVDAIETLELIDRKYENCLKILYLGKSTNKQSKENFSGILYLSKGVGMVRNIHRYDDKGVVVDLILEKYER